MGGSNLKSFTALDLLARERLLPDESFRIFQTLLAEASAQARAKRLEAKPETDGPHPVE